jgi:hypothetical protein
MPLCRTSRRVPHKHPLYIPTFRNNRDGSGLSQENSGSYSVSCWTPAPPRHGRPCAGHPRRAASATRPTSPFPATKAHDKNNGFGLAASFAPFRRVECVDGRAEPGHDAFRAAATANAVRAKTRRHIPACVPRAEARSIRLACATMSASAAGVTPSIRRAWPRFMGRTAMNFCFISLERPERPA